MKPVIRYFILLFFFLSAAMLSAQKEYDVITGNWLAYTDAANSLYHHLCEQAFDLIRQREAEVSALQSLDDWKLRQEKIKKVLNNNTGPFPEKTPLNPTIVRTIDKGSYRIEHIIFESRPGFFVTSSLYLPAGMKRGSKYPAVIYCSGHSAEGYRSTVYQHVILNLVSKGFIVFAFDPVGQGERLEYFDAKKGSSVIGGPTSEHSYPGAQAFLTGSSQANYMIWDGIRAVDYILTRKEVDPARIGITGRSGGGTQSSYIAAFDDRIYAAAPENYLTNYKRLLQTIGPQDAEQNINRLIFGGLDHADFLIVRAPKPALMITTTGDMFSIQGARETEAEVSRVYKAYGRENNFSWTEDDAAHASTLKNREAMYAFFQEHLENPGDPKDKVIVLPTGEDLRVTSTGQVSTSLGGETVFSLNMKEAVRLQEWLNEKRRQPEKFYPEAIAAAKQLCGYMEPQKAGSPVFTGRIQRDKYVIEKYFIMGEGNYIIPYLLFIPEKRHDKVILYLHPDGKAADASPGSAIERFVGQGVAVLAPDLAGCGEMGPGTLKGDAYFSGASHNLWYTSLLIGRSITGIRAGDIVRLASLIKSSHPGSMVIGYAEKEMAPALLHAAVFSESIDSIVLAEPCSSYLEIVSNRLYDPHEALGGVAGALREYDIPDLIAAIPGKRLKIIPPRLRDLEESFVGKKEPKNR